MKPITLKLTNDQIFDLKKRYYAYKIRTDLPYTHFQIRGDDFTITAYTSGKVVFQGQVCCFSCFSLWIRRIRGNPIE
ncbi:DUF3378 domain-containing protein [Erysipelothrix sp. D19-032]